jgi:hypothetical protein
MFSVMLAAAVMWFRALRVCFGGWSLGVGFRFGVLGW